MPLCAHLWSWTHIGARLVLGFIALFGVALCWAGAVTVFKYPDFDVPDVMKEPVPNEGPQAKS